MVSAQHNGGFFPVITLLTQCYYHLETRLNAMKRFCLCSLWSHLNVLTFSPLTGRCSEGLDAFIFFLNTRTRKFVSQGMCLKNPGLVLSYTLPVQFCMRVLRLSVTSVRPWYGVRRHNNHTRFHVCLRQTCTVIIHQPEHSTISPV